MASHQVKSGGSKRNHFIGKFREKLPQLSDPSARVRMAPKVGELGEQQWGLDAGPRKLDGTKERIGGGASMSSAPLGSSFALFRVEPSTGALSVLPLSEWYDFRPRLEHTTYTFEEAEKALEKHDHQGNRLSKLLKRDGDADAMAEDEEDDFDDGADPRFRENLDEDGREGLDMENEDDMFDDDEDDMFEEDDEQAMASREQIKQYGAGPSTQAGVEANEEAEGEDEDDDGAAGSAEWKQTSKEVLRAERQRRREQENDDDDWDDDEEGDDDEGEALLKALLNSKEPAPEAAAAAQEGAQAEDAPAGSSRSPSPDAEAATAAGKRKTSSPADEPARKHARAEPPARRRKVVEKDVVLVLHEHGRMRLKELIAKFKALITEKSDREDFMAIVKKVAKLVTENNEKFVMLQETTLDEYSLAS